MADSFIGRVNELKALTDAWASPGSAFLPVYGRRRVGKSELILHFLKSRPGLYHLGKRAPRELQIREFLEVAARAMDDPLLASLAATDWKSALQNVLSRWKKPRKFVLVFDEFQWTVESSPELPSVLQELWDRQWKASGQVFLILCGSYLGFMEREILGKKSPLFGRRTGQIFLKPFHFREAALFHPRVSLPQKAMTYFLCGGIPLYLENFSRDQSILQNIERCLLNEFAPLFREPDFLLREELRDLEKYYAILMTLSSGSRPSRDIAAAAGIGDRSLPYYLQNLVELGYLTRHYPLMEGAKAARHVRYTLDDALLKFWFRFIYPHISTILRIGPRASLTEIVKPGLDAYFGSCFETLCREALPRLYHREGVSSAFEVGSYWDKNIQIDVAGLREDGVVDLGACKWGKVRSLKETSGDLMRKIPRYPNKSNATVHPRIFLRDPARSALPDRSVRLHSLSDLYT
ncbi:MAG: ATP-binding protein [Candidatus Hydrogenedentota bacterium]